MFESLKQCFHISKEEKVKSKTLTAHLIAAVAGILLCALAMSVTAYAYFSASSSSGSSVMRSVGYEIEASNENGAVPVGQNFSMPSGGRSTFTLRAGGEASTGYCRIVFDGDQTQARLTTQIPHGGAISVTIEAPEGILIAFYPSWGTTALYASGQTENLVSDGAVLSRT